MAPESTTKVEGESLPSYVHFTETINQNERPIEGSSADKANFFINDKCQTTVTDHGEKTKEAMAKVVKDTATAINACSNPGEKPDEKSDPKKYADWKTAKEKYDADVMKLQQKEAKQKSELWEAHNAFKARVYAMSTAAQTRVTAAYKARDLAIQKVADMTEKSMPDEVSSMRREKCLDKAEIAEEIMKTGYFFDDTKTAKYDEKGEPVKEGDMAIPWDHLRRISMGIVAEAHKEGQPTDPSVSFADNLRKAAEKRNSGKDTRSLITLNDVRTEVMRSMGHDPTDPAEMEAVQGTEEYKLFNHIVTNDEMPPELRGLMIGRLAKGDVKDKPERIRQARAMLATYMELKAGGVNLKEADINKYLESRGGSVKALTAAGLMAELLEDAAATKEYEMQVARYNYVKGLTKTKDESVDKLIVDSAPGPASKRKNIAALAAAVQTFESGYKKGVIEEVKKSAVFTTAEAVYKYFGKADNFAKIATKLNELKAAPIESFEASKKEIEGMIAGVGNNEELIKVAVDEKGKSVGALGLVKEYQSIRAAAVKAGADVSAWPDAAAVIQSGTGLANANDAVAIKKAVESFRAAFTNEMILAVDKKADLQTLAEEAKKSARRSAGSGGSSGGASGGSGGGGGSYGGGSGSRETVTASVEMEGGSVDVKRINRTTLERQFATRTTADVVANPPSWISTATGIDAPDSGRAANYYAVKRGTEEYAVVVNQYGKKITYKKKPTGSLA